MLLTLKQPAHHQGFKSFHDYSPPTPPSSSRFSPTVTTTAGPSHSTLPPPPPPSTSQIPPAEHMSTPHRGLPPPAAMTLPQPNQPPPPLAQAPPPAPPPLNQPLGQLPNPPQAWQGAEESMRSWLHAKAEEDRRRQEEEKTRQEQLRLEQRKIEQDMLRTSLTGGIPPYMVPIVFAGMGGGNLPNASLEWAQHYLAQTQLAQTGQGPPALLPAQQISADQGRGSRAVEAYQGPHAAAPSTPVGQGAPGTAGYMSSYQLSPATRHRSISGSSTLARPAPSGPLPRLNTGEIQIQQPPPGPSTIQMIPGQSGHPLQQTQTVSQQASQESQSSPSIYFHHWQPPTSQAGTSGGKQPSSPSEGVASPKKRKAQGPQQPAPMPTTTQSQQASPSFSHAGSSASTPGQRRRAHSRQRSDTSLHRADPYGRPPSRHRHTESGQSTQSGLSPIHHSSFHPAEHEGRMRSDSAPQPHVIAEHPEHRQYTHARERTYSPRPHDSGRAAEDISRPSRQA